MTFHFPSEFIKEYAARTPNNCCNLLLDSTHLQKWIFSAECSIVMVWGLTSTIAQMQ